MILVFGKTGQVATELRRLGNVIALGRDEVDLSDPEACVAFIRKYAPKAVINAAAYTAVDGAEDEEDLATKINGHAPTAMARACAALEIPLVHISTDYVFKGIGNTPYTPDYPTEPQNAYGRSKLVGELGILASEAVYAIMRTSWVFSASGTNFVKTMLRLSETCDALTVVADQVGGPTPAKDIAVACLQMVEQLIHEPSKSGIYHFSGSPDVSWAEFATEILAEANRPVTITPIPTAEYPTPAKRPLNSRMNCRTAEQVFGITRPSWKDGLQEILRDLEVTS